MNLNFNLNKSIYIYNNVSYLYFFFQYIIIFIFFFWFNNIVIIIIIIAIMVIIRNIKMLMKNILILMDCVLIAFISLKTLFNNFIAFVLVIIQIQSKVGTFFIIIFSTYLNRIFIFFSFIIFWTFCRRLLLDTFVSSWVSTSSKISILIWEVFSIWNYL